jgi:hypothetical protein
MSLGRTSNCPSFRSLFNQKVATMNETKIRLSDDDLTYSINKWQRCLYETERDLNNAILENENRFSTTHERFSDYQRRKSVI